MVEQREGLWKGGRIGGREGGFVEWRENWGKRGRLGEWRENWGKRGRVGGIEGRK